MVGLIVAVFLSSLINLVLPYSTVVTVSYLFRHIVRRLYYLFTALISVAIRLMIFLTIITPFNYLPHLNIPHSTAFYCTLPSLLSLSCFITLPRMFTCTYSADCSNRWTCRGGIPIYEMRTPCARSLQPAVQTGEIYYLFLIYPQFYLLLYL